MPDEWIRQWGDPVLHEVAAPVTSFDDVLRGQVVEAASSEHATFLEGCLSYQAVAVEVTRPVAVRVSAQTLAGEGRTLEVEGHRASLLQHEIDHLDGILTLDRAEPAERRRVLGTFLEQRRGPQQQLAA